MEPPWPAASPSPGRCILELRKQPQLFADWCTPLKTNMAIENTPFEDVFSYWKWWFSNVMLVFRGASRRDSTWKMTNGNDQDFGGLDPFFFTLWGLEWSDSCVEDGDDCYRINDLYLYIYISFFLKRFVHINMCIYIYIICITPYINRWFI